MKLSIFLKKRLHERTLSGLSGTFVLFWLIIFTNSPLLAAGMPAGDIPPAEDQIIKEASVGSLIKYAYKYNPSVQEARENWRMAVEQYKIVTGYPDPELMATYFPAPIETRLGPQDWNLSLTQKIPFPGKLTKAGEVAAFDAQIAKLNLDRVIRDLIVSIRESFHELNYIQQAKAVAAHNMELLKHLRKIAETAYAQDRASLLDAVKGQSQTGQLKYDILLLDDLEKTETAKLNSLLNRNPDEPIGKLIPMPFMPVAYSLEEMYDIAENSQQEIEINNVRIEKAGKQIELARYESLPNIKVGVFFASIGTPDVANPPPDAGDDAFGIQTGISIPLWFGKNKSRISRAAAEKKKMLAAKQSRIRNTQAGIRSLFFRLENSRRLVELYRNELIPQSLKNMEIAETWFREKESTFSDFIEAQSVWYNFQLSLARAYADYGINLSKLERLVGQSITGRTEKARPAQEVEK